MNAALEVGHKIYYTGDMANQSGWFKVFNVRSNGSYDLLEIEGEHRDFCGVQSTSIGNVYMGHCNPRFVTAEAYQAFFSDRLASFAKVQSVTA